jgi:hypothetical protein
MKHEQAKTGSKPPKSVFDMNETEKQDTGLNKLSDQEKRNLDQWIKDNVVLAPGDPPH